MKKLPLYVGLGLFALLLLTFSPVFVSEFTCATVSGTVTEVGEGGVKDLVIKLSNNDKLFYINRGLVTKFDLDEMKEKLSGQQVTIRFARHASLLYLFGAKSRHIAELVHNGEIIYSELAQGSGFY